MCFFLSYIWPFQHRNWRGMTLTLMWPLEEQHFGVLLRRLQLGLSSWDSVSQLFSQPRSVLIPISPITFSFWTAVRRPPGLLSWYELHYVSLGHLSVFPLLSHTVNPCPHPSLPLTSVKMCSYMNFLCCYIFSHDSVYIKLSGLGSGYHYYYYCYFIFLPRPRHTDGVNGILIDHKAIESGRSPISIMRIVRLCQLQMSGPIWRARKRELFASAVRSTGDLFTMLA